MPSKAFLLGVGSTVATAQTFATSAQTAASIAQSTATSAFSKANNALANASGTFAGSLTVTGDFTSSQSFMRNRIINGGFDIAQRGTSFSNQSAYSLDRWFTNRNGGASGVSFYQAYAAFGTKKNWMTIQRTAGNTDTAAAVMYQAIEGINSRDLAGQTVTVSFTVGTGSTLSSTTNNVNVNIYYQTTGTDIGPNGSWTTLTNTAWSVPSNTGPTRYVAQFAIPSNATQLELVIGFTFAGTAGADDRYYVTEVQLEAGSIATPFERRSFGQELALCQRYYTKTYPIGTVPGTVGVGSNAGAVLVPCFGVMAYAGGTWHFPVTMRAIPTVALYSNNVSNTTGKISADASDGNAVVSTLGDKSVGAYRNNDSTGVGTNVFLIIHATASAEL